MSLPSSASSCKSLRTVSSETFISSLRLADKTLLCRFTWCNINACRSFLSMLLAVDEGKISYSGSCNKSLRYLIFFFLCYQNHSRSENKKPSSCRRRFKDIGSYEILLDGKTGSEAKCIGYKIDSRNNIQFRFPV